MPGRVLIIDETSTNRIALRAHLASSYGRIDHATTLDEACVRLSAEGADLILLGGTGASNRIGQDIDHLRQISNAPLLVLLDQDTQTARLGALRAGGNDILLRPIDSVLFQARLRSLMRQRRTNHELQNETLTADALGFSDCAQGFDGQANVTMIAQDPLEGRKLLAGLAAHVSHRFSLRHAAHAAGRTTVESEPQPDLYLLHLDLESPVEGQRLLTELCANPRTRGVPVIAIPQTAESPHLAHLLDLGAADLFDPTMSTHEMVLRLDAQLERKRHNDHAQARMQHGLQAATLDPLTGLHNRRYALARLAEMSNTIRDDVAVMVVDLDHFKSVNDTYGHAGGDAALKQVAKRLREQLRTDDLLARIGGEEFLVALPGCDRTRANLVAKELCAAVRDTPIRLHRRARPFHVTVSIGLACGTSRGLSGGDLLMLADQALYRSKSEGRDTVRLSQISAA